MMNADRSAGEIGVGARSFAARTASAIDSSARAYASAPSEEFVKLFSLVESSVSSGSSPSSIDSIVALQIVPRARSPPIDGDASTIRIKLSVKFPVRLCTPIA